MISLPKRKEFFSGCESHLYQQRIGFKAREIVYKVKEQQEIIEAMQKDLETIHTHLSAVKFNPQKQLDLFSAWEISSRYSKGESK